VKPAKVCYVRLYDSAAAAFEAQSAKTPRTHKVKVILTHSFAIAYLGFY